MLKCILSLFKKKKREITRKTYKVYDLTSWDLQLFDAINTFRKSKGLPEFLIAPPIVDDITYSHVVWMSNNIFDREIFEERGHDYFQDRVDQIQLRFKGVDVGETVSYNLINPMSIISAWDKSPEHSPLLNSTKFTHLSVVRLGLFASAMYIKF